MVVSKLLYPRNIEINNHGLKTKNIVTYNKEEDQNEVVEVTSYNNNFFNQQESNFSKKKH